MTNTLAANHSGDRAGVQATASDTAVPVGAPVFTIGCKHCVDYVGKCPYCGCLRPPASGEGPGPSTLAVVDSTSPSESRRGGPELVDCGLPWLEITVPQPPSVNRFKARRGNRSPIVKNWTKQADMAFVLWRANNRRLPGTKIIGKFEIIIIFERDKSDNHNRIKALMDWLQRVELIENDRLSERMIVLWGDPNSGCRVRLRPFMGEST